VERGTPQVQKIPNHFFKESRRGAITVGIRQEGTGKGFSPKKEKGVHHPQRSRREVNYYGT